MRILKSYFETILTATARGKNNNSKKGKKKRRKSRDESRRV